MSSKARMAQFGRELAAWAASAPAQELLADAGLEDWTLGGCVFLAEALRAQAGGFVVAVVAAQPGASEPQVQHVLWCYAGQLVDGSGEVPGQAVLDRWKRRGYSGVHLKPWSAKRRAEAAASGIWCPEVGYPEVDALVELLGQTGPQIPWS